MRRGNGVAWLLCSVLLVSGCATSGRNLAVCPVLEALDWPADVAAVEPGTDTETTVLATNGYGAENCGWEAFQP